MKRRWTIYFWIFTGLLGLTVFCLWFFHFRFIRFTYDAYVEGNRVVVNAEEKTIVTKIYSDDTFFVKKGELLIETDPTLYRIRLEKAKENLALRVREVCRMVHDMFALKADIAYWDAFLLRAVQDLQKREQVIGIGGVSLEDLEHARAAVREGESKLESTKSMVKKEAAMVQGTSIFCNPLVVAASEEMKAAWVKLYRTKVYAPVSGLVAQRKIQVGMRVEEGEPLLSIIPLDQIWVNANFKETQMKHMKIGQRVKLYSDMYGRSVMYYGHIVGLPGGAGNAFSLLPPQNLSGNWIKIVQRLPVRVAIDTGPLKRYPLRIGMTMHAIVSVRDRSGPYFTTSQSETPRYITQVFSEETAGVAEEIEKIMQDNIDPALTFFGVNPVPGEG